MENWIAGHSQVLNSILPQVSLRTDFMTFKQLALEAERPEGKKTKAAKVSDAAKAPNPSCLISAFEHLSFEQFRHFLIISSLFRA